MRIRKRYVFLLLETVFSAACFILNFLVFGFFDFKGSLGISFLISFLGIVITVSFEVSEYLSSKKWPRVKGNITKSEIKDSGENYTNKIEYEYMVDGTEYRSKNVGIFKPFQTSLEEAERVARKYCYNKEVEVMYNPKDPSNSYLERFELKNAVMLFIGAIIALMVGIINISGIIK